jgi:hypothetical protein
MVEWLLDLQDRPAQPHVRGHDQVPQRLRERPLAAHQNVDAASRHRRDALECGRPGALELGPGRAQAVWVCGTPVGAAGKAPVEFGLDKWGHVDAVDAQRAIAVQEPRCVDVRPLHVNPAHHYAGKVRSDEPSAAQVRADELRAPQVVGPGERRHGLSLSRPHMSRPRYRQQPHSHAATRSFKRWPRGASYRRLSRRTECLTSLMNEPVLFGGCHHQ